MTNWDKIEGEVKEKTGEVTDDESLEAEGKAQSTFGDAKEKGEDVKDELEERM